MDLQDRLNDYKTRAFEFLGYFLVSYKSYITFMGEICNGTQQ